MKTTTTFERSYIVKNINLVNDLLEENGYSSWFFGWDDDDKTFFLSIFDEHNPQEELVFTVDENRFAVIAGYRYKKVKRSIIKEEHIKYRQAVNVLTFIQKTLNELPAQK